MRQAYYITNQQNKTLNIDISSILPSDIESLDLSKVAYWLIDMHNWQQGWASLCIIRRHLSPFIYLKPVIFLMGTNDIPDEIRESSDGHINALALNQNIIEYWASKVETINLWIDRLRKRESTSDLNLSFKVLRIIASRNIELKPQITTRRISGYVYPVIEPLFGKRDTGAMETLSFLKCLVSI